MDNLQGIKDALADAMYNMTKTEAHKKGICIDCKKEALPRCYSDTGRREYTISGLCEECFDRICGV